MRGSVLVLRLLALRNSLLLALLAITLFLPLSPYTAHAQQVAEMPINPTGRVIEMVVPVNYGDFYLGDVPVRLTPDQEVEVARADLHRGVKDLLRPDALNALESVGGGAQSEHVALSALRAGGFDFRFDPGSVSIRFKPTLDQKVKGNISVEARRAQTDSPNTAKAAAIAAYVNLRSSTDYIARTPSGREGLRAPRLDLEGAARWQGVVVEAEATYAPDDVSLFGEPGQGFKRRGTRLVKDFEDEAVRAKLGDVYPIGTSFQQTPDLLGLSVERSYTKLQPGRNIRSTSRRSFRIERPSSVDVQINGLTVRRLRLDSGDYDLSDLPVATGLSDVTLQIEDDAGNRETLEFSIFSDGDLLEPGLSEWAFAAGLPSRFTDGEPDYSSSDIFLTGFYRRGLAESLTGQAHLQAGSDTVMGGAGVLFGSGLGLMSLEGAGSIQEHGSWGAALDAQYSLATITDPAGRDHNLRVAAKVRTPDFTAAIPDAVDTPAFGHANHQEWLALSAHYGTVLPLHISTQLSAGYAFASDEQDDRYHADITLSRPLGDHLSLAMSGGYFAGGAADEQLSLLMRLQYRPDRNSTLSTQHNSRDGRSSVDYNRRSGHGVGSWQANVRLTHELGETDNYGEETSGDASVDGSLQYTANRANLSVSQDSRFAGLDLYDVDQRTSFRFETALALADGYFAVGRPVSNGFAIVAPHAGLSDNDIRIGKEQTGIRAHTDYLGPALLSGMSPYTLNRVDFEVSDLPPGYDLGDGLFDLTPKYKSGYALQVGSVYTVTALGTLLDPQDKPIALLTGHASEMDNPEKRVELFTNRTGRFAAQGLAPGEWIIEMATEPVTRFALTVPNDAVGLYRAGTLRATE